LYKFINQNNIIDKETTNIINRSK